MICTDQEAIASGFRQAAINACIQEGAIRNVEYSMFRIAPFLKWRIVEPNMDGNDWRRRNMGS